MKKLLFFSLLLTSAAWGQNGIITHNVPGPNSVRSCLTSDNSGNTWIGMYNGLRKFDGANWTTYDNTNTPMTANNITAVGTRVNDVWVGVKASSNAGQFLLFDGTTWTDHSTDVNNSIVKSVIAGTAANTIWVGTQSGLYKFDGTTWTNYTVASSGLASDTVNCLAIDPSGNILAGTARGLSVQNGAGWTNYNTANTPSMINTYVTAVYSDVTNGTWVVNGDVMLFSGGTFISAQTLASSAIGTSPAWTVRLNMAKGPHGGMLTSYGGTLVEFVGNTPHVYAYTVPASFFTYNVADGKTWFIGYSSSSPLVEFDGNNYHAVSNTVTINNVKFLDVNQISTAILNRGDMHWNTWSAQYEVPKGGGAHSIFMSALWIGGLDQSNNLHQAAMTYRQTGMDFFPGPLDTTTGTTDTAMASQYDYIWKIDKTEILAFQYYWSTGAVQNGTYVPRSDFLTWPAQGNGNYTRNMAPFVDVNNNGVYDPLTGGDYPLIKGDQMLYCIYNDNLAPHTETGGQPLKVEVHFSAYAYACSSVADSLKAINYTTFYHYDIINRSTNDYHDVHIGLFQDADLGAFDDDYVGSYPPGNFCYTYAGDANDGTSALPTLGTYGANPPISSLAVLNGPPAEPGDGIDNNNDGTIDEAGEKNLLTGFTFYNNDFTITGNPETADDYYLYSSWKWKDSTDITYGGNGYGGMTPTMFMYPSPPFDMSPGAWNERTAGNTPYDRRYVASCGPFNLNAGESVSLDFADIFSRDTTVTPTDTMYFMQALNDVNRVRNWYTNNSAPSCVNWSVGVPELSHAVEFSVYPNPASTQLNLVYQPKNDNATFEVIDLTGRTVEGGAVLPQGRTIVDVSTLSPGIYLVRVVDGASSASVKVIRQ